MSSKLSSNSYLYASNAIFVEELYQQFINDPSKVDQHWQDYFKALGDNPQDVSKSLKQPSWRVTQNKIIGVLNNDVTAQNSQKSQAVAPSNNKDIIYSINAIRLIDAFRTYGHLGVALDPLGINNQSAQHHSELDYLNYGFNKSDLNYSVVLGGYLGIDRIKLSELIEFLKNIYSHKVGLEFMHIESAEERDWLQSNLEKLAIGQDLNIDERLNALQNVVKAEMFESYLHTKFPGTKRFSVEGLENTISAVDIIIKESVTKADVSEFVLGMAHRGRLNTLTNIMGKPFHAMFSEFKGEMAFPSELGIPGDVKYHLGVSSDIEINGKKVHMTLTPNPSHLEVVNAVVLGKVRAKQDLLKDIDRSKVLGILIHGDAAFSGQGSVMEALSLSQLQAYHTGGTIHIVANNQIGFTTNPKDSRSTTYCTDIAKFIGAPILHVDGDDADSVISACKIAASYRAIFKKDVVIDIIGYRKYGHNEGDEPFFTQPIMYNIIKNKKNPAEVYIEKLVAEGMIALEKVEAIKAEFKDKLDKEFELSKEYKVVKADWLDGKWSKFEASNADRAEITTGVKLEKLKKIGNALSHVPNDFKVNPKIARQLEAKDQMFITEKSLDWAAGEALGLATLLDEGFPIRMTGQDVERGTFSHRHAVLIDQDTENQYIPMNNMEQTQKAKLEIKNSNLSEFGVLGFEYGYSFTHPGALTIWEAQFGDFANGAQVIIDQYISSGEAKWLRMSGLVMLLPHGYEGQGPEHSSARLERFLQLCARDNMQVANLTTPASLYHILRRQMHRNFRKPLIIMSPKSLLRHKSAISDLKDFAEGTMFNLIIPETDSSINNTTVKKVILCSGKVYYDLFDHRQSLKRNDVAIIRLEQIYPFPQLALAKELKKYPNAEVIVWCQEEHENMGAYYFVDSRIEKVLIGIKHKCKRATYIGRPRSASPAVGYMKLHTVENAKLMDDAFSK